MKESMFNIENLYLNNLLEVNCLESLPTLTWKVKSSHRNEEQVAYQYQLSSVDSFDDILLDSGRIQSKSSANVKMDTIDLHSSTKYFLRVKCWNNYNQVSEWKSSTFITGIVNEPWLASYIVCSRSNEPYEQQAFYIKNSFNIEKLELVESVTMHATAGGIYQAYFNGKEVIDGVLKPGFTSYKNNHLYQSTDITEQIKNDNVIAFHIGAGWYCGRLGWLGDSAIYGESPGIICQIVVRYKDGKEKVIVSDDSWVFTESPVVFSSVYDGEIYDARKEISQWNLTQLVEDDWVNCQVIPFDSTVLNPQIACGVEQIERLKPQSIFKSPCGEEIVDFGQNISGFIEFSVLGEVDDQLTIEHFEVLDKDGNAHIENLRTAAQKNTFIIGPENRYTYSPHFSFQGFRYCRIVKSSSAIMINHIEAVVLHSSMEKTGHFECSNPLLNKLHENIRWGMRGNFVDIPTDCPQRDERLGWTGDAQIFSKTACYLYDSKSFFSKWLNDLSHDQLPDGGIPFVVPDTLTGRLDSHPFFKKSTHSAAGWGDAVIVIPWHLYQMYGDKEVLANHYEAMCKYIDFVEKNSIDYVYDFGIQFGDWLALDAEEGSLFGGTPTPLTGTAYFAYSTNLLAKIADILGYEKDQSYFTSLYDNIRHKYVTEFVGPECDRLPKTQTSHILPLYFDLVSPEQKKKIALGLVSLIKKNNGHLNTGFLGTPHICDALSDNGFADIAYNLLLNETYPSWLHQVKLGATTIWEHWNGIKEDGSLRDPSMNSFNHYAYGAVGQWLYSNILGIKSNESKPGFQQLTINPRFTERLGYAAGFYSTSYGDVKVSWSCQSKNTYRLKVDIPFNSKATISVEGYRVISLDDTQVNHLRELTLGSGQYELSLSENVKELTFN